MPSKRGDIDRRIGGSESEGWMASLLAEEDVRDRRVWWRLGSWGSVSVCAIVGAMMIAHSSSGLRRERLAYAEIAKQAQQVQWVAKDAQEETRRLSAAVDTLNGDRDRLYSRVSVVEQNLNSVTGSINRPSQAATALQDDKSWPASSPPVIASPAVVAPADAPAVQATKTTDSTASVPPSSRAVTVNTQAKSDPQPRAEIQAKAELAPLPEAKVKPDIQIKSEAKPATGSAADTPETVASIPTRPDNSAQADDNSASIQRTEFAVDIGSANSVEGLRALWRGTTKTWPAVFGSLQPLIVIRERSDGYGMQLRLVAGPLGDAAAAARICASLIESKRECEPSVFDGQRLALSVDKTVPAANNKQRRHSSRIRGNVPPPPESPPAPKPASGGLTSLFGNR